MPKLVRCQRDEADRRRDPPHLTRSCHCPRPRGDREVPPYQRQHRLRAPLSRSFCEGCEGRGSAGPVSPLRRRAEAGPGRPGRAHLALGEVQDGGQAPLLAGADIALLAEAPLQLLQLRGGELGAGPPGDGATTCVRFVLEAAVVRGLLVPERGCGDRMGASGVRDGGIPFPLRAVT